MGVCIRKSYMELTEYYKYVQHTVIASFNVETTTKTLEFHFFFLPKHALKSHTRNGVDRSPKKKYFLTEYWYVPWRSKSNSESFLVELTSRAGGSARYEKLGILYAERGLANAKSVENCSTKVRVSSGRLPPLNPPLLPRIGDTQRSPNDGGS